ncbi:MAG: hypothetical protein H0T77_00415 [Pyrinomonadaceae bacterium]|nr:hypothetical protein [Pyrinomonadaceae bacterium]
MKNLRKYFVAVLVAFFLACWVPLLGVAQDSATILVGTELSKVVPPGFYFQGQTAPTQMRNVAAARFGRNHYVIAGLVDTSGYAADVRAKYEGFLITDTPISINGSDLGTGAYGFGFTDDGKLSILDLAGNQIVSVSTTKDGQIKRPRPLMMVKSAGAVRLYSGKDYAVIAVK